MDLVYSCKDKLSYFRIKELKDVLTQLGLAKQGRKQDLLNRILESLADEQVSKSQGWGRNRLIGKEGVAKIIDDTYREMQGPGATELASKSHSKSDLDHRKPVEDGGDDAYQSDMKVHCPCGSSLMSDSMIRCEDPQCRVWQHLICVVIPEKPMEGVQPEIPSCFYCELCRINKADPFWVTVRHPLPPIKLASGITSNGTNTMQNVERTFSLSKSDKEMLQRSEYDLQVWCILLNDKVPFRMQWPQYAELQVNGIPVRAINRPGSQLLGINGRDDGCLISTNSREGINKICLSMCDTRIFCFGIRTAKRRTVEQVLNLVPKGVDGELLEDALTCVRRCFGGGTAAETADSDSDLEVVADSIIVNLRCPWQCPICLKNYSLENIIIDPYFNRITSLLRNCENDVDEIEVKPDGLWRVKNEGECQDLSQWHYPDGSLCVPTNAEVKPMMEISRHTKQEGSSEGRTGLKLGIKRNHYGRWEVRKPEYTRPSSAGNSLLDKFEKNVRPRSSTSTGSYRDGEDASINQEGGAHFDLLMIDGHGLDSHPLNFDTTDYIVDSVPPALSKDSDIIVLSDSEENVDATYPLTVYETNGANDPGLPFDANHLGVSQRYSDDPGPVNTGTSCLGLLNNGIDGFGNSLWQMQTGTGFQPLETGSTAPDYLVDIQGSLAPAPTHGYDVVSDNGLGDMSFTNFSPRNSDFEMNGSSLVNNPLAFGSDDPSLQIFLPSRPASVIVQSELRDNSEIPNGVQSDDWMSLTLYSGGNKNSSSANGLNPQNAAKGSRKEALVDTALFSVVDDSNVNKATSNGWQCDSSLIHYSPATPG